MSRRRTRRLAGATLAVAAVLAGLPLWATPARAAVPPALSHVADCIRQRRQLDVLMLLDVSGSLQETDPHQERLVGAEVALDQIADFTRPADQGGPGVRVNVQFAEFAGDYRPVGDWHALTGAADQVHNDVDRLTKQPPDGVTNYLGALEAARRSLADHAARAPGGPPCQLLLWFTDGRYEPVSTQAPGFNRAVADGTQRLCRPGGVIDQLRDDGVTLASVALTTNMDGQAQDFLRRLTGDGAGSCGHPRAEPPGAYLDVARGADLAQTFADLLAALGGGHSEPLCREAAGSCSFQLEPSMGSFVVLIRPGKGGARVTLRPPNGGPGLALEHPGADAPVDLAGARLRWQWHGAGDGEVVVVRGELPRSAKPGWAGVWTVGFAVPGGPGGPSGRVYLYADRTPEIVGTPRFRRGKPWTFRVREATRAGGQPDPDQATTTSVKASVAEGSDEQLAQVGPVQADGTRQVTFNAPPSWRAASVTVRVALGVRTASGIDLSPPAVTQSVPVVGTVAVTPAELRMPSITGRSTSTATLTLRAEETGGCVWLPGADALLPTPLGPATLRVPAQVGAPDRCLRVPAGQERTLEVTLDVHKRWSGRAQGTLPLRVRSDAGGEDQMDVPVVANLATGPRPPGFWAFIALLLLLSAMPIGLLWLFNRLFLAKFVRRPLKVATFTVTAQWSGQPPHGPPLLRRVDGAAPWPTAHDFIQVTPNGSRFSVGPATFRARTSANPFLAPYGQVRTRRGQAAFVAAGGATPQRTRRVPLDLADVVLVLGAPVEVPVPPAERRPATTPVPEPAGPPARAADLFDPWEESWPVEPRRFAQPLPDVEGDADAPADRVEASLTATVDVVVLLDGRHPLPPAIAEAVHARVAESARLLLPHHP